MQKTPKEKGRKAMEAGILIASWSIFAGVLILLLKKLGLVLAILISLSVTISMEVLFRTVFKAIISKNKHKADIIKAERTSFKDILRRVKVKVTSPAQSTA